MKNTIDTLFCQTKTGTKVHSCGARSSRTFCGSRVARVWPAGQKPGKGATYCGACGLDALNETTEIKP